MGLPFCRHTQIPRHLVEQERQLFALGDGKVAKQASDPAAMLVEDFPSHLLAFAGQPDAQSTAITGIGQPLDQGFPLQAVQ